MRTVFFTIVGDNYYQPVGTPILINTFKRFHPDIDLVVFRQDIIDAVFAKKHINFYMAKPTFAKLLTPYYDRVVNIDADTIILSRLDEVIDGEYDVGAAWNFNDYENMTEGDITEEMFVQAGLVASSNKDFWDIWERENKEAMKYRCQENSILNLIWYKNEQVKKMKRLIFDKEKNYLGCKSLGREHEFYMEGAKVMCRGEQVKAYHWAKGGGALPKMQFHTLPFKKDVQKFMEALSYYGKSVVYGSL